MTGPVARGDNQSMSDKPSELQFRPLHEGLGFHPFSDGLPYAPAVPTTRKPEPMGTGAVAAGPARPVRAPIAAPTSIPAPRMPSLHAPKPAIPLMAVGSTAVAATTGAATTGVTAAIPQPSAPRIEKNFGWSYPVARSFAFLFDLIFNLVLTATAVTVGLAFADLEPWFLLEGELAAMTLFFLVAFCWALMATQEIALKTTLGKRLVGLKLRGSTAAIFLRAFFFIPSVAFGGVGILWALFDRDKRCWHDVAVDLQPTRITQL